MPRLGILMTALLLVAGCSLLGTTHSPFSQLIGSRE